MFTSRQSTLYVQCRTFCRTVQRVIRYGKVKYYVRYAAEAKASVNSAFKSYLIVKKAPDELWIAEKFQSNSEIAGSPRNSFRASLEVKDRWG